MISNKSELDWTQKRSYKCYQVDLPAGYTFFSAVYLQVSPQSACTSGCIITVVACCCFDLPHCPFPLPVLVGNNRVYRVWRMLVSYYLPGNSLALPPSHRVRGVTAQEVVEHCHLRVCGFPALLSGDWAVEHAISGSVLFPALLSGGWAVEHSHCGLLKLPQLGKASK